MAVFKNLLPLPILEQKSNLSFHVCILKSSIDANCGSEVKLVNKIHTTEGMQSIFILHGYIHELWWFIQYGLKQDNTIGTIGVLINTE